MRPMKSHVKEVAQPISLLAFFGTDNALEYRVILPIGLNCWLTILNVPTLPLGNKMLTDGLGVGILSHVCFPWQMTHFMVKKCWVPEQTSQLYK